MIFTVGQHVVIVRLGDYKKVGEGIVHAIVDKSADGGFYESEDGVDYDVRLTMVSQVWRDSLIYAPAVPQVNEITRIDPIMLRPENPLTQLARECVEDE